MKKSRSLHVVLCLCLFACGAVALSSCQSSKVASSTAMSSDKVRQKEFEDAVRMLVETE